MNSPIRGVLINFRVQAQIQGNLTDSRVQVPSDTLNSHNLRFRACRTVTRARPPAAAGARRFLLFSFLSCWLGGRLWSGGPGVRFPRATRPLGSRTKPTKVLAAIAMKHRD